METCFEWEMWRDSAARLSQARSFRAAFTSLHSKSRSWQCAAKRDEDFADINPGRLSVVDFRSRLGFVAVMLEFPRPVLIAHRVLYAGIILCMAPGIWRMVLQPVIMLSDFPATVLALTVTLAGFVLCWLSGKAHWLLLLCDAVLISIAALYFWGR